MKKARVYIKFEDGSSQFSIVGLENNLSFGKKEMEKWIKEDKEKDGNKIVEISVLKFDDPSINLKTVKLK
jgi:hypothetical protein